MFKFKQHTGYYHNEMNNPNFEEWLGNVLLPNPSHHSIIVMDNAPYHSNKKEPTPAKSWRKGKIIDWLFSKGNAYLKNCKKCDI